MGRNALQDMEGGCTQLGTNSLAFLIYWDAQKSDLSKELLLMKDLTGVSAIDIVSRMTDSHGLEICYTLHGKL
ncbi:hypothetical protein DPMN_074271 [Dreissena polymorpha]|uniref:Uncharacterized protein n=1 Tax=Dreissena polymorpha TaxID=45954 RepID=A0A9D4BDX3_DREPO|nr:hypothetical protein DPMN_074271 [Dreissena polymorpha]